MTVLAPAGTGGAHRDRWHLPTGPGGAVEVWDEDGAAMDYHTGSPFEEPLVFDGVEAGVQINLTRIEG